MGTPKIYHDRPSLPIVDCVGCGKKCRSKMNPPRCKGCAVPRGKHAIAQTADVRGLASDARIAKLAGRVDYVKETPLCPSGCDFCVVCQKNNFQCTCHE